LGVTNPRKVISYSATFSACGRSVAWPVVLELLQDLKESDTNAVCLSSAADALEQGVSVTFFVHFVVTLSACFGVFGRGNNGSSLQVSVSGNVE